MKNLIIYFFVIHLFVSFSGFSQQLSLNHIYLGTEVGPNIAFLYGNTMLFDYNVPGFGFSTGISFQYNFKKIFSLKTNVFFERKTECRKGQIEIYDELGNSLGMGKGHTNFDYIILPVLFRINIGNQIKFFVNVGPYFGLLLQEKEIGKVPGKDKITVLRYWNKQFDMGMSLGIGVLFPIISRYAISLEYRDNLGLINISKLPVYNNGTIKTNSINLLLGFAIKIGGKY